MNYYMATMVNPNTGKTMFHDEIFSTQELAKEFLDGWSMRFDQVRDKHTELGLDVVWIPNVQKLTVYKTLAEVLHN